MMLLCSVAWGEHSVNVSSSLLSLPTVEEARERLEKLDQEISSLSFQFVQKLEMKETGLLQRVEGNLKYLKPDRIRLEHRKPREQLVITDKKTISVYIGGKRPQLIRTAWDSWVKTQASVVGLMDFGNYGQLLKKHDVSVDSTTLEGTLYYRLTLLPKVENQKSSHSEYTVRLYLLPQDFFPMRIELLLGQMFMETELSRVSKNPVLKESLFKFEPPPGVELLEFR
ncbi:MAG: outer membrane lipoprotein carrier protein LolA [Elusimicrobia bacterium]|nr:outer membrane lipoprotein carrier protein LolA [Elusimicrobiota bacterium]